MKRARRKETNENHHHYLTRSKKQVKSDEYDDQFSLLPLDLKKEILLKLPPKSLANLILVSKLWSSILSTKDFTELYLTQSSSFQPRLLFATQKKAIELFQSFPQENQSANHHHHHTVNINWNLNARQEICSPTGGLICYGYDRKVVIGNPFTGQFITLPRVKTIRKGISTFFGYDPVNDVYKVLCLTVKYVFERPGVVSEEHQVFTLGDKKAKWRMITCKYPHLPFHGTTTQGVCKNGVVYYLAWINNHQSLISFDLRSEEFNVIKLPKTVELLEFYNLVKYSGKIALTSHATDDGTVDLVVLEDANKQEWSKVSVLVPSWKDLVGNVRFWFKGATITGELIFVPYDLEPSSYILCYNLKESKARKVVIEGTIDDYSPVEVFFDHFESSMTLPMVS